METKKEEAIRKAYGEYWEQVKGKVDEEGWFYYYSMDYLTKSKNYSLTHYLTCDEDIYKLAIRPKSIQGIENNNGWQRVEDGFPPENSGLYFVYDGKDVGIARMSNILFRCLLANEVYSDVTHYQPIVKPKPPIY